MGRATVDKSRSQNPAISDVFAFAKFLFVDDIELIPSLNLESEIDLPPKDVVCEMHDQLWAHACSSCSNEQGCIDDAVSSCASKLDGRHIGLRDESISFA